MATNEEFMRGEFLSLPVTAETPSGSPVVVGELVGVATTAEGEGGNADGFASVTLIGVHRVTVTGAVNNYGQPIYIASDYTLSTTAGSDRLFGHAYGTKGAAAAVIPVRLAGHAHGAES